MFARRAVLCLQRHARGLRGGKGEKGSRMATGADLISSGGKEGDGKATASKSDGRSNRSW